MPTRRRFLAGLGATATVSCVASESPRPATAAPAMAPIAAPSPTVAPQMRFDVRAFGAAGNGTTDDTAAITAAIKAATLAPPGAIVFFPRGRYLLGTGTRTIPSKTPYSVPAGFGSDLGLTAVAPIVIQDVRDLSLVGEEGTTLIPRDPDGAVIALARCRNLTISTFAIDYEGLLFTQGSVAAVNETANTIDVSVQRGYPDPMAPLFKDAVPWITVRASDSPYVLKAGTSARGQVFFGRTGPQPIAGGLHRFSGVVRGQLAGVVPGDRFVYAARTNHPGVVSVTFSEACVFERITTYSARAFVFNLWGAEAMTFRDCVIEPLPGSDRLASANGDGLHSKWCRVGPKMERCRFVNNQDNGFNINGSPSRVLRVEGSAVVVDRYDFYRQGDEVAIVDQATGLTRGTAKIQDATLVRFRDGPLGVGVRLRLDAAIAGTRSFEALYGAAPLPARNEDDRVTPLERRPDFLADLDVVSSGYSVRGCSFIRNLGTNRLYGSNGVVEDNLFQELNRNGLQIGLDLFVPEVYNVRNLAIRRNKFVGIVGETNILIEDKLALQTRTGQSFGNRDIRVEENKFEGFGTDGAILVANAEQVQLARNEFTGGSADAPVVLGRSRSVSIDASQATRVATTPETDRTTLNVKGPITTVAR